MSKNKFMAPGDSYITSEFSYIDPEFTTAFFAQVEACSKAYDKNNALYSPKWDKLGTMMHVPEGKIVAGDNKHAVRESVPEFKFDKSLPTYVPNYNLDAPPNVLTVDEFPYPSAEFSKPVAQVRKKQKTLLLDKSSNGYALDSCKWRSGGGKDNSEEPKAKRGRGRPKGTAKKPKKDGGSGAALRRADGLFFEEASQMKQHLENLEIIQGNSISIEIWNHKKMIEIHKDAIARLERQLKEGKMNAPKDSEAATLTKE